MIAPEMTSIIELTYDYPARLVEQLKQGQIQIGLVPVAVIPQLPGAQIVSSYGIAAEGTVGSVALFSHAPIEEVKEVVLDYQSRTSVALCKMLFRDHWKKPVRFIHSTDDAYMKEIQGGRAGLIIGDRALVNLDKFPFIYDLSAAWHTYTGLPFVFAVWLATGPIDPNFLELFEQANARGLHRMDTLAEEWALPGVDMQTYFKNRIHYRLDESKKAGLNKFLSLLAANPG